MFKFPFKWLCSESEIHISYEEMLEWFGQQGFEIASIENIDDDQLIEIEVKANRPDMLSVSGVLRELYISKRASGNVLPPKNYFIDMGLDFSNSDVLSRRICVQSSDVHRYYGVEINDIDNTAATPDYILNYLKMLGVAHVNAIVDISNYVLLLLGQPTHVFDVNKIEGDIVIQNTIESVIFTSLNDSLLQLPKGSLLISDDKAPLCLAGIIGSRKAEVSAETTDIIIESANFNQIVTRTVSKQLRISTMASYRFERGVDTELSELGLNMIVKLILDVCGGNIRKSAFRYCDREYKAQVIDLSVSRTNTILGSRLTMDEIGSMLEQCYFKVEKQNDELLHVEIPSFRLDIEFDVDLIEEVGRIYGYHNIVPQPITLYAPYQENRIHKNANILRDIMVGYGFIEVLNYGFIHADSMEKLCLEKGCPFYGDVRILNPLSNLYELMRPTLSYNLITTAINNLSVGKGDIKIFEIGKCFYRQSGHDIRYYEKNMFAVLLYGNKHQKGFGRNTSVKYNIYDAVSMAKSLFDEFNMPVSIRNSSNVGFLENGYCAEILLNNKIIGSVGKISKKVLRNFENGKLAKDDMFFVEFCCDEMKSFKKCIQYESAFPNISREYNLLVKDRTHFCDYKDAIYGASELVISVNPIDVYFGSGVTKGYSSVLLKVDYNAISRTLTADEITDVETLFLRILEEKYNIVLKA